MATKKEHTPFYAIIDDVNKQEFVKYDVMPYLMQCYQEDKTQERPLSFSSFKEWVERKSLYMYWSRCEYEIVLKPWVSRTKEKKIDVHRQIMMNQDIVTRVLMENLGLR